MDLEVNANDHFGNFANGKWSAQNPIPAAYGSWGVFMMLRDKVLVDLQAICEAKAAALASSPTTSTTSTTTRTFMSKDDKIGSFWKAGMDEEAIDALGASPLVPFLTQIDAITTVEDFAAMVGTLHAHGLGSLFGADVIPDLKDSSTERLIVAQGGLGLPDREYYLEDAKAETRAFYVSHVEAMLTLALPNSSNSETIRDMARTILTCETTLAMASKTKADMRDIASLYNPQSMSDLSDHVWPWMAYFATKGYSTADVPFVINGTPTFFDALAQHITLDTLSDWKNYLKWHTIQGLAPYLSSAFVSQAFSLNAHLSGALELEPRYKRVLNALNGKAGELLGQVYCDLKFRPEAKAKALEMIENLRVALDSTLEALVWMGPETKVKAREKLAAMGVKIGYPDVWTDYTDLQLEGSYCENILRCNKFENHVEMTTRVDKPVQLHRWEMPPQVVNAYYHPMRNEIVFPAAVLQAPAFDPSFDDALNYGAIGAVIGHEMTHGFDDQGRLFDAKGNMVEWWQPEDTKKFNALATTCINQFNKHEMFGRPVNGDLTQGENIADIGGVKIAYLAYCKATAGLTTTSSPTTVNDLQGYTSNQRFFIAWAQFWASNVREAQALKLLAIDVHSPSELRAFAPLKNVAEFYEAFNVVAGDGMYLAPEERVTIWG